MKLSKNQQAFLALVRAGLWERESRLLPFGNIDFKDVYRFSKEQSVVGLVAAGIEHICDVNVPKEVSLSFVGTALQLERRNSTMNDFVVDLIRWLRKEGICTLLVKGQGVAQCYERPLWRACGDVDLLFDKENYQRAKKLIIPRASMLENEIEEELHIGLSISKWIVELHGTLHCNLSFKIDKNIDEIQEQMFLDEAFRPCIIAGEKIYLPMANEDVLFVFTHFLKHFYNGGIGLRQVCDWCRLLWTFCESIDVDLLETRLKKMGLMSEWKAFGALAVEYLGIPINCMPLYEASEHWKRKADKLIGFIMEVGNFGQNRDQSYYNRNPYIIRKFISFLHRCNDLYRHSSIFPFDSIRFFPSIFYNGIMSAANKV